MIKTVSAASNERSLLKLAKVDMNATVAFFVFFYPLRRQPQWRRRLEGITPKLFHSFRIFAALVSR